MSNDIIIIFLGLGFFAWGLWELKSEKAFVRKDWGWEYMTITKLQQPIRYWFSCIPKSVIGFLMVTIGLYRWASGA